MKTIISVFALLLSGCLSITTEIMPPDRAVQPLLEGRDCTSILLGIGFGTNTVDRAMRQGGPPDTYFDQHVRHTTRITRLHALAIQESYAVLGGHRCLIVTGEP
jgi:hypothetical protein